MAIICELCKTANDDDNQFCDKCGNPLVKAPPAGAPEEGVEEEEKEKVKPKGIGGIIFIFLLILLIPAGIFGYFYYNTQKMKTEAQQAVINYLNLVKNGEYAKALQEGTGKTISKEWEVAFKDFLRQLAPPMPENENVHQTKLALNTIKDGIEKYYDINRNFPPSLKELTPVIMESLPPIPGGGEYSYEADANTDNYTVFVKGKVFEKFGISENFPAYSKRDGLQCPGEKRVFGKWQLNDYTITDAQLSGEKMRVSVKERDQFGPTINEVDGIYTLQKSKDKWVIDIESSPINIMTFSLEFTQMENITEAEAYEKAKKEAEKAAAASPTPEQPPPDSPPPPPPAPPPVKKIALGMALLSFYKIASDPKNMDLRLQYQMRKVGESMGEIARALDKYYRDHDAKYPKSLQALIPKYLESIPKHAASMEDIFTEGYEVSENQDAYTLYSKGSYFKKIGIEDNYPLYSNTQRFIQKSSDIKAVTAPEEGEETETTGEKQPGEKTPSPPVPME